MMKSRRKTKIAVSVGLLAAATTFMSIGTPASDAVTAPVVLRGTVAEPRSISLTKAGIAVTRLKAGTYTLRVRDTSEHHNFRLKGPGVNRATTVAGVTSPTWTVKLTPGTYVIKCDPHGDMRKTFRVVA